MNVDSVLEYWENYLLFHCVGCGNHLHICSCLVNLNKNCTSPHVSKASDQCSICLEEFESSHHCHVKFQDASENSITITFSHATAELFLYKFPSIKVVNDISTYTDFITSLKWHQEKSKCRTPFLQSLVVKKHEVGAEVLYTYVSGTFEPALDSKGYVWDEAFSIC